MLRPVSARAIAALSDPPVGGAMLALLTMLALAAWMIRARVKPE